MPISLSTGQKLHPGKEEVKFLVSEIYLFLDIIAINSKSNQVQRMEN